MWPWGHAAAGFLVFVALATYTNDRRHGLPVVAVLVGTQFPDLVDKPLAWTVPLLPSGRSLAHSFVTAGPVLAACLFVGLYTITSRVQLTAIAGFVLGAVVHILTDGLYPFLDGSYADLTFMMWPLLPLPKYETGKSFAAHFQQFSLSGTVAFEFALVGLALVVWVYLQAKRRRQTPSKELVHDAD